MLEPIAQIDDLITIEGYGNRVFRVDYITEEKTTGREGIDFDIFYDCHCVVTAEYMLGGQDDIEVVCKAPNAEAYLRTYETPAFKTLLFGQSIYTEGDDEMFNAFKPKQVAPVSKTKEPTRQERIDALLDERLNLVDVDKYVVFEDEAPEAYKQRRYDEIDAQIRELTPSE